MDETGSIKTIGKIKLTEQTKIRQYKITEIENYFHQKINQRKLCSKKLSKYVTAFDYIDKILVVLGAASGRVYITLFTSVVGASIGIASASFASFFSNRNH